MSCCIPPPYQACCYLSYPPSTSWVHVNQMLSKPTCQGRDREGRNERLDILPVSGYRPSVCLHAAHGAAEDRSQYQWRLTRHSRCRIMITVILMLSTGLTHLSLLIPVNAAIIVQPRSRLCSVHSCLGPLLLDGGLMLHWWHL